MGVMRVNKTKNFTVMSNYHLSDKKISLRAKGLLSLMLSLPDDWNYSIAGLTNYTKDGKDAIMTILKELEDNNYLVRTQLTNDKGQFAGYDYDIYEVPQTEKPFTEKPNTDKPNTDSPTLLNTNNTNINNNTNKQNTNTIKENIKEIFDYWNSKEIIVHRDLTDKRKRAIASAIKNNSVDDIKTAIDHYEEMLHSDYEYCDYPWSLEIFLGREKGFTEFLDDGYKWINYLKWKKNPNPKTTYNNPTYHNPKEVVKKKLTKFEEEYFAEQEKRFYEGK